MCHNPQTRLSSPQQLSWMICRGSTSRGSRPGLAFASVGFNNRREPVYSWTIASVSTGSAAGRATTFLGQGQPLVVSSVGHPNTTDKRKPNITSLALSLSSLSVLSSPTSSVLSSMSGLSTSSAPTVSPSNHFSNTILTSQTQPQSTAFTRSPTSNESFSSSIPSLTTSLSSAHNSSELPSPSLPQEVRSNTLGSGHSRLGSARLFSVASNLNSHRNSIPFPRLVKNLSPTPQTSKVQSTIRLSRQTQRNPEWPQFASNIFNQFFTNSQMPNMISSALASWFH